MTYRPTEFRVENHTGISLDIHLYRDCPMDDDGTVWFEIEQDDGGIVLTLHALEMLREAAQELLDGYRGSIKPADPLQALTDASEGLEQ